MQHNIAVLLTMAKSNQQQMNTATQHAAYIHNGIYQVLTCVTAWTDLKTTVLGGIPQTYGATTT